MPARVTPVIVTFNSAAVLGACLASLRGETLAPIVIDNASSDASAALAAELGAHVCVNLRNEGFGRAMNSGAALADSELLLLVNPDLTFDPGAIAALLKAAQDYPGASLFGPRLIEPDGRVFFPDQSLLSPQRRKSRAAEALPAGDCTQPFLSGACYLVRRDAFQALGGFDPNIFLFYEDDDLCRRFADAGSPPVYVHGAVARHARGKSSAPAKGRQFKARWHLAWSRIYVARKYGLAPHSLRLLCKSGVKYVLAAAMCDSARRERHGGTIAGVIAALLGKGALRKENLE